MKRRAAIATVLLVLVGVGIAAFHYLQPDGTLAQFQGWVEADLIFVRHLIRARGLRRRSWIAPLHA